MWNIEPKLLCRKHLIAEHGEIHKAVGNLRHTGKWTNALVAKGYLDPSNFQSRHDQLVIEMLARGYKHLSPLDVSGLDLPQVDIDVNKSLADLKTKGCECDLK